MLVLKNTLSIGLLNKPKDVLDVLSALTTVMYNPDGSVRKLFTFKAHFDEEPTDAEKDVFYTFGVCWESTNDSYKNFKPKPRSMFAFPKDRPLSDVEQYFQWKESLTNDGYYWGDCSDVV